MNKNFNKQNYLFSYDNINKYNLVSSHDVLKIKKITVKLSIKDQLLNENEEMLFIYYYAMFLYFCNLPKVISSLQTKSFKAVRKGDTLIQNSFFFTLSKVCDIENFMFSLLKIHGNKKLIQNFISAAKVVQQKNKNEYVYSMSIPVSNISDFSDLLVSLNKYIHVNDLNLELKFFVKCNNLNYSSGRFL